MLTLVLLTILAAEPSDCAAFAKEVSAVCEETLRTDLDVSCSTQILKVNMAREQAKGDLFNVGNDNVAAANSGCRSFHRQLGKKLAKARKKKVEPIVWGSECAKFRDAIKTKCLPKIGRETVSDDCRGATDMLRRLTRNPKTAEMQCKAFGQMMKL